MASCCDFCGSLLAFECFTKDEQSQLCDTCRTGEPIYPRAPEELRGNIIDAQQAVELDFSSDSPLPNIILRTASTKPHQETAKSFTKVRLFHLLGF